VNIQGHVKVPDPRHPKQVQMYYWSGTVAERTNDVTRARRASGQPTDADAAASGGRTSSCTLKVWRQSRHIKSPTPSVHACRCSLEEQSCQILSRSDLKRRSLRLFGDVPRTRRSTSTRRTRWVATWDEYLIQKYGWVMSDCTSLCSWGVCTCVRWIQPTMGPAATSRRQGVL